MSNSKFEELIPPSRVEFIVESFQTKSLEDEDQFPLGDGKIATYYERGQFLEVYRKDTYLGQVKVKQLLKYSV